MRTAELSRKTKETDIVLKLSVDGNGESTVDTGVPFLDHMLTLFAKHGRFNLELKCDGDIEVDAHHTTEDIAICLGKAFKQALGDCRGIKRYGDITLPMDETLILAAVDISGRGAYHGVTNIRAKKVGNFDTELNEEFWQAFATNAGLTLHIRQLAGNNSHHIIEGCFKAASRALSKACEIDPRFATDIPSSKGLL